MSSQLQNFYKTTITRNWTATTGDFNVSVKPTVTAGWLVISPNNSTLREIVKYTAVGTNAYGDFITISNLSDRGLGGTIAQVHTIGESVRMNLTAEQWAALELEISQIIASGSPDANTTTKGLVEEATEAEIISKTAIGGTGAKLFIPVDKSCATFTKVVSVSSAEIKTLNSSPKELIAAPGSGKVIAIDNAVISFTYGTVQYASGGATRLVEAGSTTSILGTSIEISSASIDGASSFVKFLPATGIANGFTLTSNKAINLYATGDFTTGDGTLKVFIKYRVLEL